jgi:hypothetical protein
MSISPIQVLLSVIFKFYIGSLEELCTNTGANMTQRLKRWESPRREGRNDKGRGGSARQRQKRKQTQALRQKLKQMEQKNQQSQQNQSKSKGRDGDRLSFFIWVSALGKMKKSSYAIPFTETQHGAINRTNHQHA